MTPLPGTPGPTLEGVWQGMDEVTRSAFLSHLLGGTSADWLAGVLKKHGHQVSATTIKTYRQSLKTEGSVKV